MTGINSFQQHLARGALVGVIASRAALVQATRLRRPPDFFELRLDALRDSLGAVARTILQLRAPLLLTARHPAEGGLGNLRLAARRDLLRRFLEHAAGVDLELRSVRQMESLREEIQRRQIALILSSHHLRDTPPVATLRAEANAAAAAGATIFKVATRTDNAAQLGRLGSFFATHGAPVPVAAMGMGKLGRLSRQRLAALGSVLQYAALGPPPHVAGQPSLSQLQRTRRAYIE
ncbi:MAG: type I 3-dehydroquinate dehydratase [Spartobacteria bacterium]